MYSKRGFTLIELVMVIVILAILAVVAIPKYFDLQQQARLAAEQGVAGGVRSGIATYFAENKAFPASLDTNASDGACLPDNVCFDAVLGQGAITADWTKAGDTYTGPAGNNFTYNSTSGELVQIP